MDQDYRPTMDQALNDCLEWLARMDADGIGVDSYRPNPCKTREEMSAMVERKQAKRARRETAER